MTKTLTKLMTFLSATLICLLANVTGYCQFYDTGQDRFRALSMIKTEHFKVIFPKDEVALGQQYANSLECAYNHGGQSLKWKPRRISAVLFTSSATANGEVAWAPRRMNLLTTASPDNYQQNWNEQLALHEFRHVVQSDKLNQCTTRFFNILLGEQFTGLVLGLHIPYWFLEGDAVAYETGASDAGRGRTGDFENLLSAQVAQKGIYSYPKAMFGSYRDFVPSRYHLGYQLISYGRMNYGPEIWDNSINRVAKYPIAIRPFGRGIKMTTGLKEASFYRKALASLIDNEKDAKPGNATLITRANPKDYTNYYVPQRLNGKIVTYREQYSDIPAFVATDTASKRQKRLVRPGQMSVNHFSAEGDLLVWNQMRFRRWDYANYSQIMTYNVATRKKHTLAKRGRYYASTLSHDAKSIASACYTDSAHWSITIHDTNGKLLKQIPTDDTIPARLAWSDDDGSLYFIGNAGNFKSIICINLTDSKMTSIADSIDNNISNLTTDNGFIYFTGTYGDYNAWFRMSSESDSAEVVATSKFGIGTGSVTGDSILFTYYTADGYQIAESRMVHSTKAPMPTAKETAFTKALSAQEEKVTFNADSTYKVEHYSRLAHLLNIHSWGPLSIDVDNAEIGPGLTFMSQDALSTSFLTAGYQYKYAESKDNYFAEYEYKGFFPIFGVRGDIDRYNEYYIDKNNDIYKFKMTDKQVSAYAQLPMCLKTDAFNTALTLQTAYFFKQTSWKYGRFTQDTSRSAMSYTAYAYTHRRMAYRDLQPRLGISARVDFAHHLSDAQCNQTAIQGNVYLPGILKNHGIQVSCGLQVRNGDGLLISSIVPFPRGCKYAKHKQLTSLQTSYALPLLYPDLNMGILYIKRIKAKAFFDYAQIQYNGNNSTMQSAGCDLSADFHIFRFPVPISAGVRYARRLSSDENYFGLLFTANFSSLMNF